MWGVILRGDLTSFAVLFWVKLRHFKLLGPVHTRCADANTSKWNLAFSVDWAQGNHPQTQEKHKFVQCFSNRDRSVSASLSGTTTSRVPRLGLHDLVKAQTRDQTAEHCTSTFHLKTVFRLPENLPGGFCSSLLSYIIRLCLYTWSSQIVPRSSKVPCNVNSPPRR